METKLYDKHGNKLFLFLTSFFKYIITIIGPKSLYKEKEQNDLLHVGSEKTTALLQGHFLI